MKIKRILLFAVMVMFLVSCADKYVCGNKSTHKKRAAKSKSMAPSMNNR